MRAAITTWLRAPGRTASWDRQFPIAQSGAFEARASAQYDRRRAFVGGLGRRRLELGQGLRLRDSRERARIADEAADARRGAGERPSLMETAQPDRRSRAGRFAAGVSSAGRWCSMGNGNPWVFFRTRVNLPQQQGEKGDVYRALLATGGDTVYRDGRWTPMMEFTEGYGRIDSPMAPVRRGERADLAVVWVSDGRRMADGFPAATGTAVRCLPAAPSAGRAATGAALSAAHGSLPPSHLDEARDIAARARLPRHRSASGRWRIVRGDIHRHTDLSWDGNRDGSLDDSYRYALDAVGFDYLGVCDHQAGQSISL